MKEMLIQTAKAVAYFLIFGAVLTGLGILFEGMDEADCAQKGKALGAEVKFYHDRCYVKGYSDGR